MNTYGYSPPSGRLRHSSIWSYTFLSLSESVCGGHPLAPQQAADVVDLTRADAGQVHVDQRLLDALLATPVAFDDRRLEDRALQLGHLESEPAGLDGEPARVVAGPVRLASIASLVSGGVGD